MNSVGTTQICDPNTYLAESKRHLQEFQRRRQGLSHQISKCWCTLCSLKLEGLDSVKLGVVV